MDKPVCPAADDDGSNGVHFGTPSSFYVPLIFVLS